MKRLFAWVCVISLNAISCGSDEEPVDDTQEFIAFDRDFADFLSWDSFVVANPISAAHAGGIVNVYYNTKPRAGASVFATRTLIVKTVEHGTPQDWELHAMAKRGADFNPDASKGWEFMELKLNADEVPIVIWRGAKPPLGHGYEIVGNNELGPEDTDCNSCHSKSPETDFVLSPDLKLN